jgi:para-aminobenzoate synthetase/4-amino-4-deoxychorismate lyase
MIKIAPERIDSASPFYFHKTTHRPLYEKYSKRAQDERITDYIFLNEHGEITEGCFTNLFIEKNGIRYTPPVSCGLLDGIKRRYLLGSDKKSTERILSVNDLHSADAIYLCNSVRGTFRVSLSED